MKILRHSKEPKRQDNLHNESKSVAESHIVEEYQIGNTKIRIADDYCIQSQEEAQKLLGEIAQVAIQAFHSTQKTQTKTEKRKSYGNCEGSEQNHKT